MQHCGIAGYGLMLSLRDPQGKPHVTAEVVTDEAGYTEGSFDSGTIVQLRGKQNAPPERKYWPMVRALVQKMGLRELSHGAVNGDDAAVADGIGVELTPYPEHPDLA